MINKKTFYFSAWPAALSVLNGSGLPLMGRPWTVRGNVGMF